MSDTPVMKIGGEWFEVVSFAVPTRHDTYLTGELRVMDPNDFPPEIQRPILRRLPEAPSLPLSEDVERLVRAAKPFVEPLVGASTKQAELADALKPFQDQGERFYVEQNTVIDRDDPMWRWPALSTDAAEAFAQALNSKEGRGE